MELKITPNLWFDMGKAEEAAEYYVSIFDNSKNNAVRPYPEGAPGPAGEAMTVEFELDGVPFIAINGGPQFKFDEAVSFQVLCETQADIDYFWSKLSQGGEEGPCGWLKDKFGLSWQVVPTVLPEMLQDPNARRADRAMKAMLQMRKLDIAALQRAQNG